jgi:eukaryotic-like serine/threonine-protein kinase
MAQTRILGDRYEIRSLLGTGGMASVYLGYDRVLDRPVAVKVLSRQFANDATFVERFRREAQAAAALNHPNVVSVFDTGSDGDIHYIVMEYVQGRTLSDIIRDEGPLLPERAAEIAEGMAAALSFAHRAGLVHRDVKPANVMITPSGDVKVMDFGIARAQTGDSLTRTESVLGTATYFSPEQAKGEAVDARSDIYALGVVLNEMLTGRPPFTGDTAVTVAMKHVRDEPAPPSRANPDVPPPLDAIVLKCLAKNPENRYQTAQELAADLSRFRAGRPVTATPVMAAAAATQVVPRAEGTQVMATTTEEQDSGRAWRIAFIVGGIVVALGLIAWFLISSLSPTETKVRVPDVTGQLASAACDQIEAQHLKCDRTQKENSDTVDKNFVISYDPTGEVPQGTTIHLVVSSGKKQVFVPNVVCLTYSEAQNELQSAGFTVVRGGTAPNKACNTPGMVAKQDPASPNGQTKAPEGSVVRLFTVPQATTPPPTTPPPTTPPPTTPPPTSPPPTSPPASAPPE